MKTFDLYGIKNSDLETSCRIIEQILNIELIPHESSYHGGAYFRLNNIGQEHFILQRNYDKYENEWFEEEFKDITILFYVNQTERAEKIEELLTASTSGIILLRREHL